jgi:3-hydroxyisobutyrate dehydrogenase-like beta-hydroxyacid dehydrogenase
MAQRIAILGLGTMGMGMAKDLLKTGFAVSAYKCAKANAVLHSIW